MSVPTSRVKISRIQPIGTRIEDLSNKGAFLGISLNSPVAAAAMARLIDWSTFNFNPVAVLLGDYIDRHNLILERKGDSAQAGDLAMAKAAPFKASIENAILHAPDRKVGIVTSKEIVLSARFNEVLPLLEAHFQNDSSFRTVLLGDVNDYLDRTEKQGRILAPREEAMNRSTDYILEELAMFSILMEQGLGVQLYPGRHLNILVELANKKVISPVYGLNDLICIDLSVAG